jgi:GTPase SAR1 family protein
MDFTGIIGDPGSGKTNMLVRILYREYKRGTPIISNISSIKFPQTYMGFDDLLDAVERNDPRLEYAYVGTDELGVGADSYDFLSPKSRALVKFNTQRRKFGIRWAYTVQRQSMITFRLRQLTSGYISMNDPDKWNMRYPDGRRARHHKEVCQGIFEAEFWNADMMLVRARPFNGRKYWPLYDTNEKIEASRKVTVPDLGEDDDY